MIVSFIDSPNASWLNVDIAVEIINRMIAEQMSGLHEYCSPREQVGMSYEEYRQDPEYQEYIVKIKKFRKEVTQLYKGEDLENILDRVENEYAPCIKNRFNQTQYA